MGKFKDLSGERFGRLVVLKRVSPKGVRHIKYLCKCDCGNETIVSGDGLKYGDIKSCGCLRKEVTSALSKSMARKITYTIYEDYIVGDDGCGHTFMVDVADYDIIKKQQWTYSKGYWSTSVRFGDKWAQVMMHHFIMPRIDGYVIDHIDRNGSNNRRRNLRYATVSQNGMNSKVRTKNSSGITGVWLDKRYNIWCASLMLNGKSIWLGEYKNKDEAIEARLQAEAKYFKEFAPQWNLFEKYKIEVADEGQIN